MAMERDFTDLAGKRVLIVEDEHFLAEEMAQAVRNVGGIVLGPVADVESALRIVEEGGVDASILDIRLGDDTSFPIASALKETGVPVIFVTGYDDWFIPNDLDDIPVHRKPTDPDNVVRVLFKNAKQDDPADLE
ncbi:hypothetical protein GCM10011390_06830 [Aureimonas endophytica]|uniref:Response regulatory domain-containing protein n=1 Tax=Aureimonas endophytica TaxID=2027858 RepID=A0A916ZDU6_9HYPH|nr:response regulator [Aureimonas endophytica]GGD90737.1 hypothetical protein GCM10011390_06830 [Aureimonas endophytica]